MSAIFFGTPPNVQVEQIFPSRKALVAANLHRSIQHGIDGNGSEGVAAIVLSGGYEDDVDLGDEIIYTGHGGNDPVTKKQIEHQSWESHGNKGLVVSKIRSLPVRVIRGFNHNSVFAPSSGYKYGGLFKVVDNWEEIGRSGYQICRFKLVKVEALEQKSYVSIKEGALVLLQTEAKEPKWFSIGVEAPKAQRISYESKMAQLLLNKKVGDTIDFGNGFKILEIKKYLIK
jgi:predicted restriction endonuclease